MATPSDRPLRRRLPLLLSLLGGGLLSGGAALADPLPNAPWRPSYPGPQLGWVQAQRDWAEQSYRQTRRRLDQLEWCLRQVRQPWQQEQCLRRDEQARQRQWQRDQQEWQVLLQRPGAIAHQPWRPVY